MSSTMQPTISNFRAACESLNIDFVVPVIPDALPFQHRRAFQAHYQLIIVAQALNREANGGQDWYPDWNNFDQRKWYPWFDMETYGDAPAGSGFAFRGCVRDCDCSYVGSRLCFLSRELAEYAGKTFLELYRDYFLLNPQQ